MTAVRRALHLALLCVALATPASALARVGPDYVSSDNLELVNRIKLVGDGVGARIVGKYLYVTSTKSLDIFDIATDPENPKQVGFDTLDVEFENEEVPTNGKILGISGEEGCPDLTQAAFGCLTLFDVSDPANIKQLTTVTGAGDHTSTCILDCTWFYGSAGSITDAHDPAHAKKVGNWKDAFPKGYFKASCHHLREIQPGIIIGSCQPIILMSVRAQDGGSPMHPVILATGSNKDDRFIHSGQWPNGGTDRFMLIGGETNASPICDDTVGAFTVWNASAVRNGLGGFNRATQFVPLDELRPTNGTYLDGRSPYNGLGCSVHWFEQHPTFHDGGLVALAEYENGTRLLQITPDGHIVEQGYFLPLAGSTSAPHWNPNGKVIYNVDYARGVDVLRYTGPTYVPSGPLPSIPTCDADSGFDSVTATPSGRGLKLAGDLAKATSYGVTVTRNATGTTVADRPAVRFSRRKAATRWNGRGARDGYYTATFTATGDNSAKDVRTIALQRVRGKFKVLPQSAVRTHCGLAKRFDLSAPVFGGRRNVPLVATFQSQSGADKVELVAKVGDKVIKRASFTKLDADKTYTFTIPASAVPKGKDVTVSATIVTEAPIDSDALTARRL